jgi:peptide chain release factor 1
MFDKIKEIEDRYSLLESELSRPEIVKDQKTYQKYSKEHSHLGPIIKIYRELNDIDKEIDNNRSLLNDSDPEIRKLAREELDTLGEKKKGLKKSSGYSFCQRTPMMRRILSLR